jgi:two-component system sensor histidine kinase DesK
MKYTRITPGVGAGWRNLGSLGEFLMPGLKEVTGSLRTVPAPWAQERDAVPWELALLCSLGAIQGILQLTKPFPAYGSRLAIDTTAIIVLYGLIVFVSFASTEHWPRWRRLVTLLALGLVTYLPVIVFGNIWGGMAGYFGGSALILLSGWAAWTLFAGTIGSMILIPIMANASAADTAYLSCSSLVLSIAVFAIARLSHVIRYVDARSSELAQFAVIKERMRLARDLHDMLGYGLSAIILKTEFARRQVNCDPGRARDELAEVLGIAREALADARVVANCYRKISLAKEAAPVASLLAAAGIDAQVEIRCGVLDEKVDVVLAIVLREAATNVLRHSQARNCSIEAGIVGDTVHLRITNDGVRRPAASDHHGSGLENLSTRLAAIGGRLTAQAHDSRFSVLAEVPLTLPVANHKIAEAEAGQPERA